MKTVVVMAKQDSKGLQTIIVVLVVSSALQHCVN